MEKQPSCLERVGSHYDSRMEDIRAMWAAEMDGNEEGPEDTGPLNEYGLSFDYVAPDTFSDQAEGYFRYQISCGGPSDEFRFYTSIGQYGHQPHKIEYWFFDWYDGAHKNPVGEDFDLLVQLFNWMTCDGEFCQHMIDEATK